MYPHRQAPPRCAESPPPRRALAHSPVPCSETAAPGVRVASYAACWDCEDVYMEGRERFAQLRSLLLELNQLAL
jgi:hypothetical protein